MHPPRCDSCGVPLDHVERRLGEKVCTVCAWPAPDEVEAPDAHQAAAARTDWLDERGAA